MCLEVGSPGPVYGLVTQELQRKGRSKTCGANPGLLFDNIFNFATYQPSQAREDIKGLLEALPEEERNVILDPRKTSNKSPAKQTNRPETTLNLGMKAEENKSVSESSKKRSDDDEVCTYFVYLIPS